MNIVEDSSIKHKFEAHFRALKKLGFTDFRPFINDQAGFSVQRSYSNWSEVTLIKVALLKGEDGSLNIYMDARFGELRNDAIVIRLGDKIGYRQPIDIQESGDYSYDPQKDVIRKSDKDVDGIKIVNKFYEQHIKSTHYLRGMALRTKLKLYRFFLRGLFDGIAGVAKQILWILTGEKYRYDPFFPEEPKDRLNDRVTVRGIFSNPKTINFFGYEAKRRTIVFYSYAHFVAFLIFYSFHVGPHLIKIVLENNFLTVIYVISSLAIIENALPRLLKVIIRQSADISLNMNFKKVSVK